MILPHGILRSLGLVEGQIRPHGQLICTLACTEDTHPCTGGYTFFPKRSFTHESSRNTALPIPFLTTCHQYDYRGASLINKCALPKDHRRALGIVLL